jgi:energy-coupling factor transporter ATP-binding protein EcfA2
MPKKRLLFLSHSGVDTENARDLKRRIESSPSAKQLGLKVWFDKDDLDAGKSWQRQLEQAIQERCTAFAVCVGSKGVMNWVESEVSLGLSRATADRSFPFIPILAQKSTASALPPFAALYQAVRDPLNDPAQMEKLLTAVLGRGEPVALLEEPFVGLRAMTESEADRFFGRTAEIDELVRKLEKSRLVAVVADSGSGKSSLVLAGLIPKFRGGAFADPARQEPVGRIWHVVTVRPGSAPFDNLRKAVITAAERLALSPIEKAELGELIEPSKPQQIAYALQCNLPAETTETLLVIDQFEELFTQTPERLRAPFIDWLLSLTSPGAVLGFRVVLTMRSDYFNLCSTHPVLFDLLRQDDVNFRLKQITAEGLAAIVREPLRMAGHTDQGEQDALISQIKRDVSDRPGDLALIQMALFETWKQHKLDNSNLLESYTKVGGISGALAHAAEEVRAKKLNPKQQDLLEPVFVRLINLGDTGGATRRVARIDEFDGSRRALIKLLSEEGCSRLLLLGTETVDICHEQLITQWPWLQSRITESAVDARRLVRLIEKVSEWNRKEGKDKDQYLATGAELEVFGNLARRHGDWLSTSETEYVTASKDARQRAERRRTWQFRGVVATSVLFAVAFAAATFFYWLATKQTQIAVNQREQTERQLDRANRALARGIWSDLVFVEGNLTSRELNALWSLRVSDTAIRDRFVEELATVPDNLLRFGARPYVVARALGLGWPSPAEARRTLDAVLRAMPGMTDPKALQRLAQAVQALADRLTDASHAQQALDAVLQAMRGTTDASALRSLAQAVQALPGKLTDAQAQQALGAVLQAMQTTTNFLAVEGLTQALQAVSAKLSNAQAQQALVAVLHVMQKTTYPEALEQAAQALAGKLTDAAQTQPALDAVLQALQTTTDAKELVGLALAVQALANKLADAQAQQALDALLHAMRETTDATALMRLASAMQALPGKLTEAQAQQALDAVLQRRWGISAVFGPAQAVAAVAGKLTDVQEHALEAVLQAMQRTTDPNELVGLDHALQAVAGKLNDAQAQQALDAFLQSIQAATSAHALWGPVGVVQAVAGKLTDAQAQRALDALLHAMRGTTDAPALMRLTWAMQALPGKLTDAQAQQALDVALQQMLGTTDIKALPWLGLAVQALAGELTDAAQAQRALDALVQAMQRTTDAAALVNLTKAMQALPAKLTDTQAQQALHVILHAMQKSPEFAFQHLVQPMQLMAVKLYDAQFAVLLQAIRETIDAKALVGLALGVQAIADNLTEAQAQQALDAFLQKGTTGPGESEGLALGVRAVAGKLDGAQAQRALDALLQVMQATTEPSVLIEAVKAIANNVTEVHAPQALEAVLETRRKTTQAYTHQGLARAVQSLAGKLTDAQAQQVIATRHLNSAFAWSATSEESVAWAEAIVTLLRRSGEPNFVSAIVELLKYPMAAGPATDVLLKGLRMAASTAPGAEAGLSANLRWLADNYRAIYLRSAPGCPTPIWTDLACPSAP